MESANPIPRLRRWWASQFPPLKRPSRARFFVWLPLWAASAAAVVTLSPGWVQVGFLFMIAADVVLDGIWPSRIRPAPNLTPRELLLVAAAALLVGAVVYLAVVSLPRLAEPSPLVARIAIGVIWVVTVVHNWRRVHVS